MHTISRWNSLFFTPSHHSRYTQQPKRAKFLQPFLFALGCLSLLALFCLPTFAQQIAVSDQKPGSLLVFPYYNTQLLPGGVQNNARIAISNTSETDTIFVHMFFLEGATCTPSDFFICLTRNGGITMQANDIDPNNFGYIIAVAVNEAGTPVANNSLIGNAFINAVLGTELYIGNYSAESFAAFASTTVPPATVNGDGTATLNFNGGPTASTQAPGYDRVPNQFAIQIQNFTTAPGQRIVTAGLRGNMTIVDPNNPLNSDVDGAGQEGTGRVISEGEIPYSFNRFLAPGCQANSLIQLNSPRLAAPLATIIPATQTGQMKIGVGAAVGLIMTPQSTNLAAQRQYIGIRTLHKTAVTDSTLIIPVFVPPSCATLMGN